MQGLLASVPEREAPPFHYDDAVALLTSMGADEAQVRAGSMPPASLDFCGALIAEHRREGPLLGLHIGNFVGISLAYFSGLARRLDEASRVVSIDPNVPHRGIVDPGRHVLALLSRYGLLGHNLILTGYTLEKNPSNDGYVFAGYDPAEAFAREVSCDHQLDGLLRLSGPVFDFCVVDGNHEGSYLARELDRIDQLLRPGGLLILDDVSGSWPEIQRVYAGVDRARYEPLGADGRVGVLKKRAPAEAEPVGPSTNRVR